MGDLELIWVNVLPPRNKTFHNLDKVFIFRRANKIRKLISLVIPTVILPTSQYVDNYSRHLCDLYDLNNFHQLMKENRHPGYQEESKVQKSVTEAVLDESCLAE